MGLLDEPTAAGALLRRAVRVALFDEDDRVLLARYAGRRGPTWIFVGRCAHFEAEPTALTPEEQGMDVVVRWWTPTELVSSAEHFEPDVPGLVASLLADGVPRTPYQQEIVW